ncbi:hypothetical protein CEG14_09075 [Bordetella genomosp. 1]|uniref:Uncharacterized protein n=1 Tax=Bordetella genomosp. 1 TaxID=1395607 RepID=A0A261SE37_9BORD|nr:hypothetical protein [Bordetella genomosp. 1]OZI35247.1 hypothetical protein CEG14_09075 [Bordetella genomosp. 1]
MKIRAPMCALVLMGAVLAPAGAAYAQNAYPAAPSVSPNDGTATPPNRPVPEGQTPPAPVQGTMQGTNPPNLDTTKKLDGNAPATRKNDLPNAPREANDNVPRTNSQGAAPPPGYPNTGGSK